MSSHRKLYDEVESVARGLGGRDAWDAVLRGEKMLKYEKVSECSVEELKAYFLKRDGLPKPECGDITLGQIGAVIKILGGQSRWDEIVNLHVVITLVEAPRKTFDCNGRLIPKDKDNKILLAKVRDPNKDFSLIMPSIIVEYECYLGRLKRSFPAGTRFVSAEEFKKRIEDLIMKLCQDDSLANLMQGVFLPVCFPQHALGDYGTDLEKIFLPAVAASYRAQFPGRKFDNHQRGHLAGKVEVVEYSHQVLLDKMKDGPVVGLQFIPMQGFSIQAQREIMRSLPGSLCLSGAIDLAVALTAHPDVLVRDNQAPGYDCSATSLKPNDCAFRFERNNNILHFCSTGRVEHALDSYSGSLVFIG